MLGVKDACPTLTQHWIIVSLSQGDGDCVGINCPLVAISNISFLNRVTQPEEDAAISPDGCSQILLVYWQITYPQKTCGVVQELLKIILFARSVVVLKHLFTILICACCNNS